MKNKNANQMTRKSCETAQLAVGQLLNNHFCKRDRERERRNQGISLACD